MDTAPSSPSSSTLTTGGYVRRKRIRTVTGCLVCRRRRVKCDEARPRCRNCSKHPDRVCEYPYDSPRTYDASAADPAAYPPTSHTPGLGKARTITPSPVTPIFDPSVFPPPPLPPQSRQPPPQPSYAELYARTQAAALAAESRSLDVLNPIQATTQGSLADTLISNLPLSPTSPLRALLPHHEGIVRRSFVDMATGDFESRLLCTATAYFAGKISMGTNSVPEATQDVYAQYMSMVRHKSRASRDAADTAPWSSTGQVPVTGKLAAAGFTLFLSQVLNPAPGKWKEQLAVGVEWAETRGGPGWVLGVSPARPGHAGGEPVNVQPLAMTMYSDMTALLCVLAALSDGTIPTYITSDPSWLIASRALQLHLSPGMPDLFEAIVSTPRIVIPAFARAVGLVSRRVSARSSSPEPDMVVEALDFEAASLRVEFETAWPARLAARPDPRRMQYGARVWLSAALVLTMHGAQGLPPDSKDVQHAVSAFLDLVSDAVADLGDLKGWIWPLLIVGCVADEHLRESFKRMIPLAKSTLVERDNAAVALKILDTVYAARDAGDETYHIHQAVRDMPELDVLLL